MLLTSETVSHYLKHVCNRKINKLWECLTDIPNASEMTVSELRRLVSVELVVRKIC